MSPGRILVTHRLPGDAGSGLPADSSVWTGKGAMPRQELLAAVREAEGLLCMLVDEIDAELIEAGGHLRVISQMAVGVDNIDLAAASRAGIPVGHTPGVLTETTADTAFALMAAACRRLAEGGDALREGRVGEWDPEFMLGGDLWETTLGIVGLGRIGQAVARRAAGFAMGILYTGPHRKGEAEGLGAHYVDLDELLSASDHVVLAAPLDASTRHMIDRRALA
ncbi:MAG: NAD(P)-dependent oxidoreductase, partial [Acidimicrobiia bacterium]